MSYRDEEPTQTNMDYRGPLGVIRGGLLGTTRAY